MAVQFIIGRSGTGKSTLCISSIVECLLDKKERRPLVLLVPEQATYQAEKAILSDKKITGFFGGNLIQNQPLYDKSSLNVLSFDRLQFLLLGRNSAKRQLSNIGRHMIVYRILTECRDKLHLFSSNSITPGLSRRFARIISELHQYAKLPSDITCLLSELKKDEHNNLAALKFSDIELVLARYLQFIEGKFIDPDIQLNLARLCVAAAPFLKNALLWIDGFAGFTASELAILTELLKVTDYTKIALCLDPANIDLTKHTLRNSDQAALFNPTEKTFTRLVEIIKQCKLRLDKPLVLDKPRRFFSSPQLAHIERNIFQHKPQKIPADGSVRVISSPNSRMEVQFVARQITRLVREKNLRYRDIAVITPSIDEYEHYIKASFADYNIPVFIDKRQSLRHHPAICFILSALQAAAGGFSNADIFSYLKSSFVPVENGEVDLLQNYCIAFGIETSDWISKSDWSFDDKNNPVFDEHLINRVRQKVITPLLSLRGSLCSDNGKSKRLTPQQFTKIIFDFINDMQFAKKLSALIEQAIQQSDYTAADENRQFYDTLIDLFDEFCEVFSGTELTGQEYLSIISDAFSQLTLALIPPTLDQVIVGSIERSRHPDLKVIFLLGASQKQFPTPVLFDSLLTDDDRLAAESANFHLAPPVRHSLTDRQYLAYIAFTRPSQSLFITFPLSDEKGRPQPLSHFVSNLEYLFENFKEETISGNQLSVESIYSRSDCLDLLCLGLGRDASQKPLASDVSADFLDSLCADKTVEDLGQSVQQAVNYDNKALLDSSLISNLFGKEVNSSATRLSTFAKCPYQHFAKYILELQKRKEFKLEPLDLGIFYHQAIDYLFRYLKSQGSDFASLSDQGIAEILHQTLDKFIRTDPFISNFKNRRLHNAYIIDSACRNLESCILAVAQMVRAGNFRPLFSEIWFGRTPQNDRSLGEFKIKLAKNRTLFLTGKIDRLDFAEIEDKKIAAVFDYKTRSDSFSWSDFYYGLDIQLPLYMLAVRNTDPQFGIDDVAGAFYIPIEVNPEKSALEELSEQPAGFLYKAKGIFNGLYFRYFDSLTNLKSSPFYNFYIIKDGTPFGNYEKSGVLKSEDFGKFLKIAENKIIETAEKILSGKITVEPYKMGTETPCLWCDYRPVCRLDWQINDYNNLTTVKKTEVLEGSVVFDGRKKD